MQPSFPLSAAHRRLRHEQRNRVSRESDERRETEMRIIWVAVRPQAAWATEFEKVALRHEFRPSLPPGHTVAVQPANDRIFRQPHPAPDLGSWQALLEQAIQQLDALWRPGHFHRFPPYAVDPPVHPHNIRYYTCAWMPSDIYIWVKRNRNFVCNSIPSRNTPENARR